MINRVKFVGDDEEKGRRFSVSVDEPVAPNQKPLTKKDLEYISGVYKKFKVKSAKNLLEDQRLNADEREQISSLMKTSQQMLREDFLKRREERNLAKSRKVNQINYTGFNFDIESKNFFTREELNDAFYKQHVNQPMIEKKAVVARSISREETKYVYDRTRGKKNIPIKKVIRHDEEEA